MATSDRLEFRSEPSGVATDSGASNTIVRTRVPIDPEAFPPAIEKSGTENGRNIPKAVPETAGGVELFDFPSEEKGGRSQAAAPPKIPTPSKPNVSRPSMLVIEPCAPIVTREEAPRRIVEPAPAIEQPRAREKSDRRVIPAASAPLERTRPVWPAIRGRIPTALAPFVCGVAVGAAGIILLIALIPSVMTLVPGFGGAVSRPEATRPPTAAATTAAKTQDKPVVPAAGLPAITPTAAAVVPSVTAPAAKQETRPAPPKTPTRSVAGPAVAPSGAQTAGAVGRASSEPSRTAAVGAAPIDANRAAAATRVASEPTRSAASARVPSEPTRAQVSVPSAQPAVTPRPAPASPQFVGSLEVSSSPPGAQVFVNGVPVGVTPLLLRSLPVGSRAVRVELDGHERWSAAVRIVADERTVIAAKLQRSSTQ